MANRSQRVQNIGSGNIIIQSQGDGCAIISGRPHLVFVPWERRVPATKTASEAQLLTPYMRITEFVGRTEEFNGLLEWATSDQPISIRLLTGAAGTGKTRMAIELMRALASPKNGDWYTGLLTSRETKRFVEQENLSAWGWPKNTLAVLDYAAVSLQHLQAWFEELSAHDGVDGLRLRVLLLEREAGGWWDMLTGLCGRQSCARLGELINPIEPIGLRPLDLSARRSLFNDMAKRSAKRLGNTSGGIPDSAHSETFDNPLDLMMSAVESVEEGVDARVKTRVELANGRADREIKRIQQFTDDAHLKSALSHMGAYATLRRGIPPAEMVESVGEELKAQGWTWPGGPGALAEVLMDALPSVDGGIGYVEPDIVGEALILRALGQSRGVSAEPIIERAARRAPEQVVGSLIRAAQDFSAAGVQEPLNWIKRLVEVGEADAPSLLLAIDSAMPHQYCAPWPRDKSRPRPASLPRASSALFMPHVQNKQDRTKTNTAPRSPSATNEQHAHPSEHKTTSEQHLTEIYRKSGQNSAFSPSYNYGGTFVLRRASTARPCCGNS